MVLYGIIKKEMLPGFKLQITFDTNKIVKLM